MQYDLCEVLEAGVSRTFPVDSEKCFGVIPVCT